METELREPWCRVGVLQLNLTPTFRAANNAERASGYIQPHLKGIEGNVWKRKYMDRVLRGGNMGGEVRGGVRIVTQEPVPDEQ